MTTVLSLDATPYLLGNGSSVFFFRFTSSSAYLWNNLISSRFECAKVDGQSNEQCDSRLFLLDLADPKGEWRQGASLPGDCGLGQTMDTITLKMGEKETVGRS